MPWFPWEEGFRWPWEVVEDASNALVDMAIRLSVGLLLGLLALLILTGKIQLPGGMTIRLVSGFGFLAVTLAVILGWF